MNFEWDDEKYQSNLIKHGISFVQAANMIQSEDVFQKTSSYQDEERILATGMIEGRHVTVVYTLRGEAVRIISARIARDKERKDYEQAKRKNRPLQ